MSQDWEDTVKEKMSEELKHRTLVRVREELLAQKSSSRSRMKWLIPAVPGLAALLFLFRSPQDRSSGGALAELDDEWLDEILEIDQSELDEFDAEMMADLELLEDLDVLEVWDGQEES